jgi:hypothetical protein
MLLFRYNNKVLFYGEVGDYFKRLWFGSYFKRKFLKAFRSSNHAQLSVHSAQIIVHDF